MAEKPRSILTEAHIAVGTNRERKTHIMENQQDRPLTADEIAEYESTMRPILRLQMPKTLRELNYCRELLPHVTTVYEPDGVTVRYRAIGNPAFTS